MTERLAPQSRSRLSRRRLWWRSLALGLAAAGLLVVGPAIATGVVRARAAGRHTVPFISSVGGTGVPCALPPTCGDGGLATSAQVSYPEGVAVDGAGNVYVADWGDNEVRKITPTGRITTVAGDGSMCSAAPNCGDGGPATSAELSFPSAVAVDSAGNLYIADTEDDEVRKVSPNGTITRLAGNGTPCTNPAACGNGNSATSASLSSPEGVAVDQAGNVYIVDAGDNEIREVNRSGAIIDVAGNGQECASPPQCGDNGSAVMAQLSAPAAATIGPRGRLYIADDGDNEIRTVYKGQISTLAGTGVACAAPPQCGDGASATKAQLSSPQGVALDGAGDLLIADWGDNEVRKVTAAGTISTVSGNGQQCSPPSPCGDGGPAATAVLDSPEGVAADFHGDIYIGDTYDHEVRFIAHPHSAPASIQTKSGPDSVVAYAASASRGHVSVRFVLSVASTVKLTVAPIRAHGRRGKPTTVVRAGGNVGFNVLTWDDKLAGKRASHGRYQLAVTFKVGGRSATSTIIVRL